MLKRADNLSAPGADMEALERYREKFKSDPNGKRIEHLIADILENKEIYALVKALGNDGDFEVSLLGSAAPNNPIYLHGFLLDLFPDLNIKITVYDIDEGAIGEHKKLINAKEIDEQVQVKVADLSKMEAIVPSQRMVISDYVINFMPDTASWIQHCELMSRSTEEGGIAFFSVLTDASESGDEPRTIEMDPSTEDTRTIFNKEIIESLLDDAGFDFIEFGLDESKRWTEAVHKEDLDFYKDKGFDGEPEIFTYSRYLLIKR